MHFDIIQNFFPNYYFLILSSVNICINPFMACMWGVCSYGMNDSGWIVYLLIFFLIVMHYYWVICWYFIDWWTTRGLQMTVLNFRFEIIFVRWVFEKYFYIFTTVASQILHLKYRTFVKDLPFKSRLLNSFQVSKQKWSMDANVVLSLMMKKQ